MTGRDVAAALWVVLLWSSNLIVQKIALADLSIFVFGFLRVALVFPLLFFYPKPQEKLWKYCFCGFFLAALYLILFGFGLKTQIGAGLSSFIILMQVFFVILCCFLIIGERPSWFQVIGILISFGGVYFLTAASTSSEFPLLGVSALIGSCLSYGIGIALSKKFRIGGNMGDVIWLSITAAPPLFLACITFEGPVQTVELIAHLPLSVFLSLLYATLVSTVWATHLWLDLVQKFSAASVMPFMLLLPVFSNILSNVIMDETLTVLQMMSGFIIIVGVMFSQGFHQRIPHFIGWVKKRVAYD